MSIRDMLMLGIGDTKDVGGSETTGTVMAKENALIKNTQKVIDHFEGEWLNNFGDGRMGDYIHGITPDKPMVDEYNRRVYYTDSFTVPAGKTMNPASSNGVIIWSRGDIVIDGTIDLRGKRSMSDDPADLPKSVNIAGTDYALAIGGKNGSPKVNGVINNTLCGYTGGIMNNNTEEYINLGTHSDGRPKVDNGELTYIKTKKASVSGGENPIVKEYLTVSELAIPHNDDAYHINEGNAVHSKSSECGAVAIVLIAAGEININGTINANGDKQYYDKNGKRPSNYEGSYGMAYRVGKGGDILYSKGGGGCATLIATDINITGSIIVSGGIEENISAGKDNEDTLITPEITIGDYGYEEMECACKLTGGKGAPAYTCGGGTVGQVKEYIITRG